MRAEMEFFIDPARCIGCQACFHACSECETHKGYSMIHLEYVDRSQSVQTVPVVCMHCESPTCADVCPADAIKPDTEPNLEHWVEFNRKYSEMWPVLVTRRDPLPDAEARDGEPGKLEKYFSEAPGEGG